MIATEADEDRFRPEADAESIEHTALDSCRKSEHITCRRATSIDQRQRVFGRNPHIAVRVAATEAGAFNEPRRGDLDEAGMCWKRRRSGQRGP